MKALNQGFGIRERADARNRPIIVITCKRCDAEEGRYTPADILMHIMTERRYRCSHCGNGPVDELPL